jgi:hypothetical protein
LVGTAEADDGPNFTFGASTSFVYDINDPDTSTPPGNNRLTYSNFEQDESFNIDLIQLGITGQRGAISYGAKLDFGDLAVGAGDDGMGDIGLQEAYLTYDAGDTVAITAGRIGTPIGYEVLEPWGNAHISRSWGWDFQPINHDGLTASVALDVIDVMVGVVNNFTVMDGPSGTLNPNDMDDEKGVIWGINAALDPVNVYFSGIYTEEGDTVDVQMYNLIVSGDLGAASFAAEGNYREDDEDVSGPSSTDTMWNVAVYGGTDIGAAGVDLRFDYTDIEQERAAADTFFPVGGLPAVGGDAEIWSVTLTGSWELADGVALRLEYRHDDADGDIFVDDSASGADDSVDTVQAQLVWTPTIN